MVVYPVLMLTIKLSGNMAHLTSINIQLDQEMIIYELLTPPLVDPRYSHDNIGDAVLFNSRLLELG